MITVPITVLDKRLMPLKKHKEDAGWDLRSTIYVDLHYNQSIDIDTGVRVAIPDGHMGLMVPRSGLGSRGLVIRNTVGIIDSSYRGPVICRVKNINEKPIRIEVFERFAQLIIVPVPLTELQVVTDLDETMRGITGFGDSGKL